MLKYFYITNEPEVAAVADLIGIDRVFVDLEHIGKAERQPMDTVKNYHTVDDVKGVRKAVNNAEFLVRINPLYEESKAEIDAVINAGADRIMLPMWRTVDDIERFLALVDGRVKVVPLLETDEAANCCEAVAAMNGIDEIHIGLNDLKISQNKRFLFELFVDGTVDRLAEIIKKKGKRFGVGGVGSVGKKIELPAENIFAEHYRIGSEMVILSRAFCKPDDFKSFDEFKAAMTERYTANRKYEEFLASQPRDFFTEKHNETTRIINRIVK